MWYDSLAFSRPNRFLTRLGYPWVAASIRRFGQESAAAMLRVAAAVGPEARQLDHGREDEKMLPLYHDPHFTFRFSEDRIIHRFHLEGIAAGRRVLVFKIDPAPASTGAC